MKIVNKIDRGTDGCAGAKTKGFMRKIPRFLAAIIVNRGLHVHRNTYVVPYHAGNPRKAG